MDTPHIQMYPDGRMDATNASAYLGFSVGTLANWRSKGNNSGPRFIRCGGRVFYYKADLDAWLQADSTYTSTAQARLRRIQ